MQGPPMNRMPNFQFCFVCNFVISRHSIKYYCCNKKQAVCPPCSKAICSTCKLPRSKRLNIFCFNCSSIHNEDQMFYDFKADKHYCAKCISPQYIYYYEKMIKENKNPTNYVLKMKGFSHSLEDFINFYKDMCFCCWKKFNGNAFEMIYGGRICCSCLQRNFDFTMPKLLMCIECNGYIHQRTQIETQISLTAVLCVYCSKNHDIKEKALILKKEQSKVSSIKSKSSINNSKVIVSAVQLSKIGPSMVKIISKSSIQTESLNFPISNIEIKQLPFSCVLCNCKFNKKSVFQLTKQEVDKYKPTSANSMYVCVVCFKKPQRLQRVFGISEKIIKGSDQMANMVSTAKIRSNRLLPTQAASKPQELNVLRSPRNKVPSPKPKECYKCKNHNGSTQTSQGYICMRCLKQ